MPFNRFTRDTCEQPVLITHGLAFIVRIAVKKIGKFSRRSTIILYDNVAEWKRSSFAGVSLHCSVVYDRNQSVREDYWKKEQVGALRHAAASLKRKRSPILRFSGHRRKYVLGRERKKGRLTELSLSMRRESF